MKVLYQVLVYAFLFGTSVNAGEINVSQIHSLLAGDDRMEKLHAIQSLFSEIQATAKRATSQSEAVTFAQTTVEPFKQDLIKAGRDTDSAVRARATLLLGYAKPTGEIASLLSELIRDSVRDVQYSALASIYSTKTDTPEVRKAIVELLRQREKSSLFRDAAKIATALQMQEATVLLLEALQSENMHFRTYAAEALADMNVQAAVPQINMALKGITENTQRQAIEKALARLGLQNENNTVTSDESIDSAEKTSASVATSQLASALTQDAPRVHSSTLWTWISVGLIISAIIVFFVLRNR